MFMYNIEFITIFRLKELPEAQGRKHNAFISRKQITDKEIKYTKQF